jgi:hypothetical protein
MNTTGQGFYYSRVGKAGFVEQRPFSDKDLEKKEQNFWYYTSLERGRPSWIGPYQADILDGMWICSYTVPIYCAGTVVGVLGMDIPLQTLEGIADDIEQELQSGLEREVNTVQIGEMVMSRLKDIDEVAYVRFASVYRSFKDINTFMEELSKLLTEKS